VDYLEGEGSLTRKPFHSAACPGASLDDISEEKLAWFVTKAQQERQFALRLTVSTQELLTHLNLLDEGRPSRSAVLLFGKDPHRFLPASELKCVHLHGTEVEKPFPSYQRFTGTLFDLVNEGVNFVLAKLARSVSARDQGPEAAVDYDIPQVAVTEAVVNAVAHRNYSSEAAVEVRVFTDRVEVWNPGELPQTLTPERLRKPHSSVPRNPSIAEALFLARYIEKLGTGTLDMISRCRQAGLPEPDFEQRSGHFVVTLWRDRLTETFLAQLVLNERQRQAVLQLRTEGRLTNAGYQRLTGSNKRTSTRDLDDLVLKGILQRVGTTGRGTYYVLAGKGDTKGTKGTS
jgi:ATP-dependent DNA helicase RecG